MVNISLESKDKLFLTIGVLMISAFVSLISEYLGSGYKIYAIPILFSLGVIFFIYGFRIMNKNQKLKDETEYLERKHRIADLILKKQQMKEQRDKNLIDGFIFEEQQKLHFGIATGVKNIEDSFEARNVPEQVLTSWEKILTSFRGT